ncbi:MAG TPA: hypothetical protein DEA91_26315 [Paenibacillus sp.]|nr:hypothetical protein [Paenibacillus sp.]
MKDEILFKGSRPKIIIGNKSWKRIYTRPLREIGDRFFRVFPIIRSRKGATAPIYASRTIRPQVAVNDFDNNLRFIYQGSPHLSLD